MYMSACKHLLFRAFNKHTHSCCIWFDEVPTASKFTQTPNSHKLPVSTCQLNQKDLPRPSTQYDASNGYVGRVCCIYTIHGSQCLSHLQCKSTASSERGPAWRNGSMRAPLAHKASRRGGEGISAIAPCRQYSEHSHGGNHVILHLLGQALGARKRNWRHPAYLTFV